ncbi:MAG: hypothetical protein E7E64_12995 [Clostridium celatum]|nr:hypothetical protein [Clostridium celatum]MDU4979836.1 hypothetical protein [Clostridium celatum]
MKIKELREMGKREFGRWIVTADIKELKEVAKDLGYKVSKLKKNEIIELICNSIEERTVTYDLESSIEKEVKSSASALALVNIFTQRKLEDWEITEKALLKVLNKNKSILEENISKLDRIRKNKNDIDMINSKLEDIGSTLKLRQEVILDDKSIKESIYILGGKTFNSIYIWNDNGLDKEICIPAIGFGEIEWLEEEYDNNTLYKFDEGETQEYNLFDKDIINFNKSTGDIMLDLVALPEIRCSQTSCDWFDFNNIDYSINFCIDTAEFIESLDSAKRGEQMAKRRFELDIDKLLNNGEINLLKAYNSVVDMHNEWTYGVEAEWEMIS